MLVQSIESLRKGLKLQSLDIHEAALRLSHIMALQSKCMSRPFLGSNGA